jgi:O-antigen/teichoic acid export membrane protein
MAADLFRYSMPFVVIFSLDFIPSLSNRFLLQHFLGSTGVGLFAASYDLGNQVLMMLFGILNMGVYPLVLRSLERLRKDLAREQLRRYSIALFALTFPASVGLAFISQPISNLLLGEPFREVAGCLLPWVAISTFVVGVKAFYFDLAFQLGLRTNLEIWGSAAAALLSVVLNLWWIPMYGLMGAVWASCTAYTLALVISLGLGRKIFPLPFPTWDVLRIGLATLCMVTVLLAVGRGSNTWIGLCSRVGLAAFVYTLAVWIMDVDHIRQGGSGAFLCWIKSMRKANTRASD